jgi:hypothetical protein
MGHDPFLTAYLSYRDDLCPQDLRKMAFGRGSRVEPTELEEIQNVKTEDYWTFSNVPENPDPYKPRAASTQFVRTPDVLQIEIGKAFHHLSSKIFSKEFIDHMCKFTWDIYMSDLRTEVAKWDHRVD